ncbi:hypothetical protein BSKO_02907 [Bryopsis sp. KO-2023]|nr:hypothetical protein BSKO_02907 [Bryopsis sp. KO-2023]
MGEPMAIDSAAYGEQSGWRAGQDLIDALPYIDTLSPEMRDEVDRLVQEEMQRSTKKPVDYLRELPPIPTSQFKGSKVLKSEYERVRRGEGMPPLDTHRYTLSTPAKSKMNDLVAWGKALDNAHSQLEHQHLRLLNLELYLKYGAEVWKIGNAENTVKKEELEMEVEKIKKTIEGINQERKLSQISIGSDLKKHEQEWFQLVEKNQGIQAACQTLEEEIERLEAKKQ